MSSPATIPHPSLSEIETIAALRDPALRNLRITQCYFELAAAFRARSGPGANWCAFATWASKQAGQTIRKEDLLRALGRQPGASPTSGGAAQWGTAVERASASVAAGNLKVFAEIGREFARFCASCLADEQMDAANIAAFCAQLRPGDPPEGQRYLQQAFRRYYAALFEPDDQRRAEALFFANLEIGFHEQTRLQPEIAAALNAAIVHEPQTLTDRLAGFALGAQGWFLRLILAAARLLGRQNVFDQVSGQLLASAQEAMRRLLTDNLMTLALPGSAPLRLGRDLQAEYPATLRQISSPELADFLRRVDPTPDRFTATGASDWADLGERLHFIADLFRAYHEAPLLFAAPFSPEQVTQMKAGRLPAGVL